MAKRFQGLAGEVVTVSRPELIEQARRFLDELEAWAGMGAKEPVDWQPVYVRAAVVIRGLVARLETTEWSLSELNERIPRDHDGRPIIGIKGKADADAVVLSNWVEPWIADAAALCAAAASVERGT